MELHHIPDNTRRAGIIPFMVDTTGTTFILLGLSNEKVPVWADLGGRTEKGETPLQTAIREFNEESRSVLSIDLNNTTRVLVDNHGGRVDQVILVVQVEPTNYNININVKFLDTIPRSKYEDEMKLLRWIPIDYFLTMDNLAKTLERVRNIMIKN